MNICVCTDNNMGISFNNRRQSRDKAVAQRLISLGQYDKIYIQQYSLTLFEDLGSDKITVTDTFNLCGDREICFVELEAARELAESADTLILYKWNRNYPSDKKLPFLPSEKGFRLLSTFEFAGNSHDKITEEIWTK